MARTPFRDSRSEAENAFKAMTAKPAELPPEKPSVPGARMIPKSGNRFSDKIMRC